MNAILGLKKDMTQVFDKTGKSIPVTLVDIANCRVVGLKTLEKDGYNAVKLGLGIKRNTNKVETGKYKGMSVPKFVKEVKMEELPKVGEKVETDIFELGDKVTIISTSKGKGFMGVVKRWGFHGNGNRTHGQSNTQRHAGSIGSGTTPGRVYKGKKMAGRMGSDRVTVKNLEVVFINKEANLLGVKGMIPGSRNTLVMIKK